ncbi:MAG: hypothetical protein AB2827_14450 [Candidatus Thiodiazotropha sp.]
MLENVVYVETSDQDHANNQLLRAVFGPGFSPPDPSTLFPGRWVANVDALGIVQGNYELELRANGQVEGNGGVSDTGIAGEIARELGMSNLLTTRITVHGSWSYSRGAKLLTIEITTSIVTGQQQKDTIRNRTTGHEKGEITGEDFAGRTWTLRRSLPRADDVDRYKLRAALQHGVDDSESSGALPTMLAIVCLGVQCLKEYEGLPIETAKKVLASEGDTLQAAAEEFIQELKDGGWIQKES